MISKKFYCRIPQSDSSITYFPQAHRVVQSAEPSSATGVQSFFKKKKRNLKNFFFKKKIENFFSVFL